MATEAPITEADNWFIGEDKDLVWTITTPDASILGYTTKFSLKGNVRDLDDDALFLKDGIVTDPNAKTIKVAIDAADYPPLMQQGKYYYELKRVDVGNNAVLAFGPAILRLGALR